MRNCLIAVLPLEIGVGYWGVQCSVLHRFQHIGQREMIFGRSQLILRASASVSACAECSKSHDLILMWWAEWSTLLVFLTACSISTDISRALLGLTILRAAFRTVVGPVLSIFSVLYSLTIHTRRDKAIDWLNRARWLVPNVQLRTLRCILHLLLYLNTRYALLSFVWRLLSESRSLLHLAIISRDQ